MSVSHSQVDDWLEKNIKWIDRGATWLLAPASIYFGLIMFYGGVFDEKADYWHRVSVWGVPVSMEIEP